MVGVMEIWFVCMCICVCMCCVCVCVWGGGGGGRGGEETTLLGETFSSEGAGQIFDY